MRTFFLILSTVVLGCNDKGDDSATGESDADTDADADTDTDTDTDVDPNCVVLTGMVVDADSNPVDTARVQMCSSVTCFPSTPSDGAYTFGCLGADDYAFEVAPLVEGAHYPNPSSPVTVAKGEHRTMVDMVLEPFTDVYESISAGTYDIEGGLSIDADPADMYFELAGEPDGFLAGMVAPFDWGLPIDDDKLPVADQGGTPIAMWYLGEFNVALTNPWPFTATNDYGLAPDTVLDVLAMDYNRQAWADGGTATVSSDGKWIVSDEGGGIPVLATLLLIEPL
jgi:hypothetical protein